MSYYPIHPGKTHPPPFYHDEDDLPEAEELRITARTAKKLQDMGAFVGEPDSAGAEETRLIRDAVRDGNVTPLRANLPAALGAAAFLEHYGRNMALDVAQVRTALTTKLLEIADCGDVKYELRAIELLGKHSDIGLFTERSEVKISQTTPEALAEAIRQRVDRLLKAGRTDTIPMGRALEEELGIYDAEFEEVREAARESLQRKAPDSEDDNG